MGDELMKKNHLQRIFSPAPLAVYVVSLLFLLCALVMAQDRSSRSFFWSLFIKGSFQGNLQMKSQDTRFERLSGDTQHLTLAVPGRSSLNYTFTLDEIPAQYYMLNDWQSYPRRARVSIKVNDQVFSNLSIECPRYISQGFEIPHMLRRGTNTIDISLEPGGDSLLIRGTILTENPSLAKNVELLPNLVPKYAKTFAIIFLVLGILYLVWFFFNRTLYKNMDTYSASFALIGIMIASVASAYCILLDIKNMINTSIVILVTTIILALLSMLTVKRSEDGSAKRLSSVDGESEASEPVSGDFNF
jgi:hypothetical protein